MDNKKIYNRVAGLSILCYSVTDHLLIYPYWIHSQSF